jgi:hypothetical protein
MNYPAVFGKITQNQILAWNHSCGNTMANQPQPPINRGIARCVGAIASTPITLPLWVSPGSAQLVSDTSPGEAGAIVVPPATRWVKAADLLKRATGSIVSMLPPALPLGSMPLVRGHDHAA